jgi:antitoxin (DNA-binding transcriptional repressor) of toxin-antitoxin stability system
MKVINIRQMRASIGRLDELVAAEGELVISRRGRPIARVLHQCRSIAHFPIMLICASESSGCKRLRPI